MLVHTHAFAVSRGAVEHVHVELDVRRGMPSLTVVGLAFAAARDVCERVQSALANSGAALPRQRVTVNIAPSSGRRRGSEFDLAVACCVLAAQRRIDPARLDRIALHGELGLGGAVRGVPGVALVAPAAADAGLAGLVVAAADAPAARAIGAIAVAGVDDLAAVTALLAPAR